MIIYIEIVGLDGAGKSRLSYSLVDHLGDRARLMSLSRNVDYLIGDRGYACFYAYQPECPAKVIDQLWTIAMRGLYPDLLVFIDTPVWLCQERIARRRNPSVIDKQPASFHKGVRERYLSFVDSYQRGQTLILDGT